MADFDFDAINAKPTPEGGHTPSQKSGGGGAAAKIGKLTFYKCQSVPNHEGSIKITKFDSDLNIESSYFMNWMPSRNGGYYDCQCPASRYDCRHKAILQTIKDAKQVDGDKFFCFETKTFKLATEIGRA